MLSAGIVYSIITIHGYVKYSKIESLHLAVAIMFLVFAVLYKVSKNAV
jgi:hypothetical protein